MDDARKFLESLRRFDLSMLLRQCRASVERLETALDWFSDLEDEAIIVRAPGPIAGKCFPKASHTTTRTSICRHEIAIGERSCPNTRIGASAFAS
jgi:hypothetical protein